MTDNLVTQTAYRSEEASLAALRYAEKTDYKGYSKFDATNSPFVKALTFNHWFFRFAWTQAVMRCPVNIRPLIGVKKYHNPKGMALFARAYSFQYKKSGKKEFLELAKYCVDWLIANPSPNYSQPCWGYNFDWQNAWVFFAPKWSPNTTVTAFCIEALLDVFEISGESKYLEIASNAVQFFFKDVPILHEDKDTLCIGYVPGVVKSIVININGLTGAVISRLAKHTGDKGLQEKSARLIKFVVDHRTPDDAWYYTYPSKNSYIVHDNYHTGGIVDAILEYSQHSGSDRFMDVYLKGLLYYEKNLFLENGAPKYMNNRIHPFDIHGSAQGIISFSKAGLAVDSKYLEIASRIVNWTQDNMYDAMEGRFYYQKGKCWTRSFTLLRWCNGWMARAMSEFEWSVQQKKPE